MSVMACNLSLFVFCFSIYLVAVSSDVRNKIDAVVLTTGKDTRVFEKSISSGLKHLVDVDKFYIISPGAKALETKFINLGPRVVFVDESTFPFTPENVSDVMFDSVRQKGLYPMDGNSPFEKAVWGKLGWFYQQALKLTAGRVLGLTDHVILDSDVVWFRDIRFLNESFTTHKTYNYASSSQYHPAYLAILKRISGVDLIKSSVHRSGVVHHMVICKTVMDSLVHDSQQLHGGLEFWKIALNQSALELTCRAPKPGICGGGSTLSEYELYFNYARVKFPQTVSYRPLMWANGPSPGLLYWPKQTSALQSDGKRDNWLSHRQAEVSKALSQQMIADEAQGYDYVGYHAYAKRRYFELIEPDVQALCSTVAVPKNTTCSWHGYEDTRSLKDWFSGCACYMSTHTSWGR